MNFFIHNLIYEFLFFFHSICYTDERDFICDVTQYKRHSAGAINFELSMSTVSKLQDAISMITQTHYYTNFIIANG